MDCVPQHATALDDRAVAQVVAELAAGGGTVVVGVVHGRAEPARRAIHRRATVVVLDAPADATVATIAAGLQTPPGRCVVVLRADAGGWDLAVGASYEPPAPVPHVSLPAPAPPPPLPSMPPPGTASRRSTVGSVMTLAAPPTMLGGGFLAGFCTFDVISPCFYPWSAVAVSGGGAMVAGPILMLSGAERDRRAMSTDRGPSFADAGFVSLAASGAFLIAAPLVEPRDAGAPITAATVTWLGAVLLGSIQLTENHQRRNLAP